MDSQSSAPHPLAAWRAQTGRTQRDVADLVSLNPASISAIETGKDKPSLELSLELQRKSDGRVRAADLRPDLADLIAEAARTYALEPAEAAA